MNGVNGYLALVAFAVDAVPGAKMAPAFNTIYGGYYLSFGQIFIRADFDDGALVYASKLASAFVLGGQLGWFSLGGMCRVALFSAFLFSSRLFSFVPFSLSLSLSLSLPPSLPPLCL